MDKNKYFNENISIFSMTDDKKSPDLLSYKSNICITDLAGIDNDGDDIHYFAKYIIKEPNFQINENIARKILKGLSHYYVNTDYTVELFEKILPFVPSILLDYSGENDWGGFNNIDIPELVRQKRIPETIAKTLIELIAKRGHTIYFNSSNSDVLEKMFTPDQLVKLLMPQEHYFGVNYLWDLYKRRRTELSSDSKKLVLSRLFSLQIPDLGKEIAMCLSDEEIVEVFCCKSRVMELAYRLSSFLGIERLEHIYDLLIEAKDNNKIEISNLIDAKNSLTEIFTYQPELLKGDLMFKVCKLWPHLIRTLREISDDEIIKLIDITNEPNIVFSFNRVSEKVFFKFLEKCDELGYTPPDDCVHLLKNMSADTLTKLLSHLGSRIVPYLKYDDYNDIPDDLFEIISLSAELDGLK